MAFTACRSTSEEAGEPMSKTERSATLGVTTAVPSEAIANDMGLAFEVRRQGRVIEAIAEASAASKAGFRTGDVLLQLDDVTLYSQDDIDDFVSVLEPGATVTATLVRNGTSDREELTVTLGTGDARRAGGIRWEYASLAQLPAALDQATAENKKVLVGLSGAET